MPKRDHSAPRRLWYQRVLIAFTVTAIASTWLVAGALAYQNTQLSRLGRYSLSSVTNNKEVAAGDPQNFLIVGIDDAGGLENSDSVKVGRPTSLHSDTIMILRVDPKQASAQLLSLPRDLWVPIADTGGSQRINTALTTGGPERLIKTIDQNFHIPISHYIQIDFAGFRGLIEMIGGVPVNFPRPARSKLAGLDIKAAGCFTLGPVQALGFARARKDYQVKDVAGKWHTDPRSDFSRVDRQQFMIQLAVRQAILKGIQNPNTLRQLVGLGVAAVRTDNQLKPEDLLQLGARFHDFGSEDLVTLSLPVIDDIESGDEVLKLIDARAEDIFAIFRGVTAVGNGSDLLPKDVTVQVLNGTGRKGQGSQGTDGLAQLGFKTIKATDADTEGGKTTVRFAPGREAQAQLLARALFGPSTYERADGLGGADAVLVTGSDYLGISPQLRPSADVPGPSADTTNPTVTSTSSPGTGPTATTAPKTLASENPGDPGFYLATQPASNQNCTSTN